MKPGRGFALVLVLCFVVLLTAVVVAFFSRALTQRQVSDSSANGTKADLFAQGAVDTIVGDLKQEIADGSTPTTVTVGGIKSTIYAPAAGGAGYYPTAVPYRAGSNAVWPNLVKRSAHDTAFHPNGGGYAQAGTTRAANSSTTQPSPNGRYFTATRWNKALLLPPTSSTDFTPNPAASFTAPDWVLAAQDGSDTHALTTPPAPTANNAVVGRYAYYIYDEGGLLDANVAGYPSTPANANTAYKNAEAYADLLQLTDASGNAYLTQGQIDKLVSWRNGATLQQSGGYPNFVVTNPTGFLKTANTSLTNGNSQSDRMFTSRQQLLDYLMNNLGSGLAANQLFRLENVLQFLGTFTRSLNQPSYMPDSGRPAILAQGSGGNDGYGGDSASLITPSGDARINPAFPSVRVGATFARNDGSNAVVGEPLVKKRFALNRLAWLTYKGPSGDNNRNLSNPSSTGPDADIYTLEGIYSTAWLQQGTADNIRKYFGLQWGTNPAYAANATDAPQYCWTYVNGTGGSINTLGKVAQLTGASAREPDFVELLKAAVGAGSIAKTSTVDNASGTLSYNHQYAIDASVDYAILQLVANTIDQFDVDGYPTTIYWSNGGTQNQFVGVENVPYLDRVRFMVIKAAEPKNGATSATSATAPYGVKEDSQDYPTVVMNTGANTLQDTGVGLGMLYPELWNPHDRNDNDINRTLGNPRPTLFDITAQSGQGLAFESTVQGYRSYAATASASPGYASRGFSLTPGQRLLTETNSEMKFSLASNATAMSLFREPTLLFKLGGTASLTAPGLASVIATPGENVAQFASSNSSLLSGVASSNSNGDTELADPSGTGYVGFYLGAFPLHWVQNGYNVGVRNVKNFDPANQPVLADITYRVKCQDPTGGNWITYSTQSGDFFFLGDDLLVANFKGFFDVNSKNIGWSGTIDPRTSRFGTVWSENFNNNTQAYYFPPFLPPGFVTVWAGAVVGAGDTLGWVNKAQGVVSSQRQGMSAGAAAGSIDASIYGGGVLGTYGSYYWPWWMPSSIGWYPGGSTFQRTDGGYSLRPGLFTQNNPSGVNDGIAYGNPADTTAGMRYSNNGGNQYYADADGVVRRAMAGYVPGSGSSTSGYSATTPIGLPMATANTSGSPLTRTAPASPSVPAQSVSRPLVLNRPFNSVADLGYVFSGMPWKNLDFFTPESGSAALLDVFCVNDTDDPNGLVAGKVNLNTQQTPVLQSIIAGAYRDELQAGTASASLTSALAKSIATRLVSFRTTGTTGSLGPLRNPAELVGKWVASTSAAGGGIDGSKSFDGFSADLSSVLTDPGDLYVQRQREAAVRALVNTGQTRTWNLLIDLVGQVGRYPPNATNLSAFAVEGEQRCWVHVAIDRFTGQVVAKQVELVKE